MLDKNVIMARLARLDEYAFRLKRFESISLEEYLGDYDIQAIVERNLQLAIQVCMDIANYIIARKKLAFPAEQENIFTLLGREGIITRDLADRIKGMVNFRNILVHDYTEIDFSLQIAARPGHASLPSSRLKAASMAFLLTSS